MSRCLSFAFLASTLVFADPPQTRLRPASSANLCGECHQSIVEAWSDSAHARSVESRPFLDALALAERDAGPSARSTCLACHAPLAAATGDLALDRKASWEGVTCDYCHSVRSVSLDGPNPRAALDLSLTKSGPIKDASSSAHPTAFSPVHESSAVCAPCHEYKNPQGLSILTTFSEWQASVSAKEGKNCQACHMNLVAGQIADAHLLRQPSTKVNLHKMAGSRSLAQLNKAVKLRLLPVRAASKAKITVRVMNAGAGHFFPTGSPMRQVVLQVGVRPAGGAWQFQEKVYARIVADAVGAPISREDFAFLRAVKALSDTRLAPGESRNEVFFFDVPASGQLNVRATLTYVYSPNPRSLTGERVAFLSLASLLH